MKEKRRETVEMSLEERTQLEERIAAETSTATVYQAPAGYQTAIARNPLYEPPHPPSPDPSKMSPLEEIQYWDGMLENCDKWLADLDSFEKFEAEYLSSEWSHSGLLIGAGKRDYDKERLQLHKHRAELHYLRALAREEAGDLLGAQKDFVDASMIDEEESL